MINKSFNKSLKGHNALYRMAKFTHGIYLYILKVIIVIISCIEVPLFLICHPRIFKNNILYPFWLFSFGHTISGLDYASRLYYPNRISVIFITHPHSNEYLPFCFQHNIDVFFYKSLLPARNDHVDYAKYAVLYFFLSVLSGMSRKFHVIRRENIYQTLSVADHSFLMGIEGSDRLEQRENWTGYMRLLRSGIGKSPALPEEFLEKCKKAILQVHPEFFQKPFATLLLREKGKEGLFDTSFRCAGPQRNYVAAVEFLANNGLHVVGTGDTNHSYFHGIPGYYSMQHAHIPKALLNLFLLMYCELFIGQQSGPFVLPNSRDVLCLICDAMPYYLGTFRSRDIILFKHLRDIRHGRYLSLVEVFKNHADLAYGHHFQKKHIAIEPDTAEEILEAAKECYAIIRGTFVLSEEDKELCDAFRKLPKEKMLLFYHGNRTSIHMLRQLKHELI